MIRRNAARGGKRVLEWLCGRRNRNSAFLDAIDWAQGVWCFNKEGQTHVHTQNSFRNYQSQLHNSINVNNHFYAVYFSANTSNCNSPLYSTRLAEHFHIYGDQWLLNNFSSQRDSANGKRLRILYIFCLFRSSLDGDSIITDTAVILNF